MEPLTASSALRNPVRLKGIQLGRPVDLLLTLETWHVLGFVVHCGDGSERFLPFAASQPGAAEIAVGSALMLLDDVGFYRSRASSFRHLLGREVEQHGRRAGTLRDLVLEKRDEVSELVLERGGARVRVLAGGCRIPAPRASAA